MDNEGTYLIADKKALRAKMRTFLQTLDPAVKRSWDEAIGKNLACLLESRRGSLGVYAPLEDEVDWTSGNWYENRSLLFPLIESTTEMSFYPATLEQLVPKVVFGFELKMPPKSNSNVPAMVLVPGLAFSKRGARLGRGKGYFDRYLSRHRPMAIGVSYEGQLNEALPVALNDWPMNFVVTEKAIYDCAH
ncbi:MAG: 5-formyltetrahydrofolate cyclo-ligase [Bdellovibrionales bacterium GWA2_49_15]|nr:MAG: 5-formyltetrahydrofolate cyclo-ligase [Bdellovibrionales bacterium GWA2_49_15]HAZ13763.1 5-formyltetrahydrofolate cyclo-ligase [Bdellovibrionales bacterium]